VKHKRKRQMACEAHGLRQRQRDRETETETETDRQTETSRQNQRDWSERTLIYSRPRSSRETHGHIQQEHTAGGITSLRSSPTFMPLTPCDDIVQIRNRCCSIIVSVKIISVWSCYLILHDALIIRLLYVVQNIYFQNSLEIQALRLLSCEHLHGTVNKNEGRTLAAALLIITSDSERAKRISPCVNGA
jgi:hypothetical protein